VELTFMGGGGGGDDILSPDVINGCVALQRDVLFFATSPSAQAAMVEKEEAEAGEAAVTKGSGTK
jgi:hypothetical protein